MPRFNNLNHFFLWVGLLGFAILVSGCNSAIPEDGADHSSVLENEGDLEVRVHQYTNETAIDFQYSTNWILDIPRQGIIALGPEQTVYGNEIGPFVVILRIPFGEVHGNLEGEFNHYLDFGPLRDGYTLVEEVTDFEVDGRPALQARLTFDGNSDENTSAQEAWVVASEANNGVVYIVSSTAPPDEWTQNEILFKLLVQSLKFNE